MRLMQTASPRQEGQFCGTRAPSPAGKSPSDDRGCSQVSPEIGITSTPVIDRARNAIYLSAMSKDSSGNYYQRIHALDLTTGKELFGGPTTVQATYPGTGDNSSNGSVVFDPSGITKAPD